MSRDVAIPDQAPARARPRPAANLTQRASLNVVASLLDYGAKIAVNFLVIPILVTGLGRSLYGVWEMLGRLVGYLTAGDGRPTQALDRKSTRLNSSHTVISYAVFCLKKKRKKVKKNNK